MERNAAGYDMSPEDAAAFLGVHPHTLKKWARAGKVPCWRTPGGWLRFRRADLEALLPGAPTELEVPAS